MASGKHQADPLSCHPTLSVLGKIVLQIIFHTNRLVSCVWTFN